MLWRSRSPISFFKFESIQEIFWMTIPYTGCDPRSLTLLYFNPTVATENQHQQPFGDILYCRVHPDPDTYLNVA